MTPFLKNRWNFLSHLKDGALFYLVEVDLRPHVSSHTLKKFGHLLKERSKTRSLVRMEEDRYHDTVEMLKEKQLAKSKGLGSGDHKVRKRRHDLSSEKRFKFQEELEDFSTGDLPSKAKENKLLKYLDLNCQAETKTQIPRHKPSN